MSRSGRIRNQKDLRYLILTVTSAATIVFGFFRYQRGHSIVMWSESVVLSVKMGLGREGVEGVRRLMGWVSV